MRIEEEHMDVLQNIEMAVAILYRRHPDMTDYAVLRTYEALVQCYTAEVRGRDAKTEAPSGLEAELLRDVKAMCEWRLGRATFPGGPADTTVGKALDVPTLLLCLKRLVQSVQMWTKNCGRQGYLTFMTQFMP